MATPEQDRAIAKFLPSVDRSRRLSKLKPYLLQGIIFCQAAAVVTLAFVVAPLLWQMFNDWGPAMHEGGIGATVWFLSGIASKISIPMSVCIGTCWWLEQQKKLLRP